MTTDHQHVSDAFQIAMARARDMRDQMGMIGYGVLEHRDGRGRLIEAIPVKNLITNAGDLYYAGMGIALVTPAAPEQPTKVARMKLGTGTTAPNKATPANEVIQTYITGSVKAFDATYPQTENLGNNLGVNAVYKTTWVAGEATNTAITEATITSSTADSQGAAADTISRLVFSAVNKAAADSLALTWKHKMLGAP